MKKGVICNDFIGTWKCIDDDCPTRYIVERNRSGHLQINAYDMDDNERLEVDNVKATKRTIKFDLFVPSNGYRSCHHFRLIKNGTILQKITISEIWVKEHQRDGA
ncbi:MAG: hypothetical protein PHW04_00080 [Candidatus Wallbacteria bacterium]|nr:hypothetical protein [Candidatus Wallbacteria bacterium]